MFLVCTGALQAIPADLKEAASIDGASGFMQFRQITFPLLLVTVAPLLVSSFAFNFNNYNAIKLLTEGGPFDPANPTAGGTDILISYTIRLAFGAGGHSSASPRRSRSSCSSSPASSPRSSSVHPPPRGCELT